MSAATDPAALPPASRERRRAPVVGAMVLAFVLLTVLMTWPLPLHAGSAVQDLGDPLYQIWVMRWIQHELPRNPANLWNGNAAYPFRLSLLFGEPALSTALLAWPLRLLSGNDLLAYNALFLASFVVLGTGMALLVTEVTGVVGAGLLAGIVAAYTPYRFGHLSHLNLLSYGWFPLALWALVVFARTRRGWYAVVAATCLTIQLLASDTLAIMSLGMLAVGLPFVLWPERQRLSRRFVVGLLAALGVPLAALAPDAAARLQVGRVYGFARDLATIRAMSATPRTYLSISPFNRLWRGVLPHAYPNPLFPGAVAAIGALLGLVLAGRRWPRWTLYGALLAGGGFVLSLGPNTVIAGRTVPLPYLLLFEHVPGWSAMRDVARFGMVALLGLQLLAGLGFAAGWLTLRRLVPSRRQALTGVALVLLVGAAAVAELRSDVGAVTVPRDPATLAVYRWLAGQPRGAVFELPANGLWTGSLTSIDQVYYSTYDWQPVVADDTSFLPRRYLELLQAIHANPGNRSLVDVANVGLLQDIGIRYVVIHHADAPAYDWRGALAAAEAVPALHRVGAFGSATVFTLDAPARHPVAYRLDAPSSAAPGATFPALLLVRNPNGSAAVTTLGTVPAARATWTDAAGRIVATQTIPITLPVAVPAGDRDVLVAAAAPRTPGRYRVHLTVGSLAPALDTTVDVRPSTTASGPAVLLQTASWANRAYRPGDTLEVRLVWQVRRPLTTGDALTVQLIDSRGQLFAQHDGYPFDGQLPTTRWLPGMTVVQVIGVRLPATAPPGPAQILVALYDPESQQLPRLTIGLPTGGSAPQALLGPLTVAAP
ncbi:MAG TPA: hypothetical protein VFN57_03410 [Thermomicrobiaceae bacterium]|nr:hypothetical protein [Thermomicrobiaceae bacterium]